MVKPLLMSQCKLSSEENPLLADDGGAGDEALKKKSTEKIVIMNKDNDLR